MSDIREKIKRQIEIIASAINEPGKNKIIDLELIYNCNSATIKRDLKDIRAREIDIHSIKGKGVEISNKLSSDQIKEMISEFVFVNNIDYLPDKATHFLADSRHERSIVLLALLQRAISGNYAVKILYKKNNETDEAEKTIEPLFIFQRENNWRLLAREDGKDKQFLLSRIMDIKVTEKKFKVPDKQSKEKLFSNSFGAWLGDKTYSIKLKFDKSWNIGGDKPTIMQNQKVIQTAEGYFIVEFEVNSLEELARWIVGRGNEVMVLEPKELKDWVLKLANEVIVSYKENQ